MVRLIALAVVWLLWSGHYTLESPLIAGFGVASCVAVWWMARRMRAEAPHEVDHTLTPRALLYLPWLLKEIISSSLTVARIVVSPDMRISPRIIRVPTTQRGEGARVLFANSITLTPGTISLEVRDGMVWVHALTEEIGDDLMTGEMDRRVTALERAPLEKTS